MSGNDAATLDAADRTLLDWVLPNLGRPAEALDAEFAGPVWRERLVAAATRLGEDARAGDGEAFRTQQTLLSRIYDHHLKPRGRHSAEGSVLLHEITRQLERDTIASQDACLDAGLRSALPTEPAEFTRWIKEVARAHRAFKHPYYHEFIRNRATAADLRSYIVQESTVDARFDDLLALMQVGTDGGVKMEIAANYWDEMGNGRPADVHTVLFNRILTEFSVTDEELAGAVSAEALLSGNLAVLTCRYRHMYGEAVGYLAMTEWLVPDRFRQVLHAWRRLGLPPAAIVYHDLHIGVDARHAAGWFHNVVEPAARDADLRYAIARGALWRLNSSARYLDGMLGAGGGHG